MTQNKSLQDGTTPVCLPERYGWVSPLCVYICLAHPMPLHVTRSRLKTLEWGYPVYTTMIMLIHVTADKNVCISHMCDVVEVRDLSSGFCSNWTSWANYSNLHWTRKYLVKEGTQSHCPVTLYSVCVPGVKSERQVYTVKTDWLF